MTDTWIRYNQVRLSGDKKTANKLLTTYIQLLKQQPAADIRRIVDELCHQILDKSDDVISNYGVLANPDLLIDQIAAFSAYCQQADDKDIWRDTLSYWEFFANCWADYCANPQPYEHFKAYLHIRAVRESDARFLDY